MKLIRYEDVKDKYVGELNTPQRRKFEKQLTRNIRNLQRNANRRKNKLEKRKRNDERKRSSR
jgi:hypothetical protein